MRISLNHGEDTFKAYEAYSALIDQSKARGFEIVPIGNIKDVVRASLFEDKIVFTLERPGKVKLDGWKWFKENAAKYNSNLLIYYEGKAPITLIRNLPKDAKIQKFEFPKILFTYLDSLYPGNSKMALKLFDEICQTQATELVMFMMARHVRDLYWVLVGKETLEMPIWRIQKLARQAGKFNAQKLEEFISKLALIDVKSKIGEANLKQSLDLLIVEALE